MEFFAWIGLATVAWIIYDLTKYIFIDYYKEEAEAMAKEAEERMTQEEFVFDRSDDQLNNKVFNLVTHSSSQVVNPINRSLKKIGSYIRLYYHILSIYGEYIDEDPNVRMAIYRIEMLRREAQTKLDATGDKLDNAFRVEFKAVANTILLFGGPIIDTYEKARDWCLSREMPSKLEQVDRIYRVLDAEKRLFRGYPDTRSYYEKLGETYLAKVYRTDEITAQVAEIIRNTNKQPNASSTAEYLARRGRQ